MKTIPTSIILQLFIILLILSMGSLLFTSLTPYLSGFLGALTLYILLIDPMKKLMARKWRPGLAALFLLVLSFFCILLPFVGVGLMRPRQREVEYRKRIVPIKITQPDLGATFLPSIFSWGQLIECKGSRHLKNRRDMVSKR